jgi:CobQ-like glutamine amidotransferase family enzyme
MKEIKILHLFPKLLSLYGEYGNVAVLRKTLEDMGCHVTVDTYEIGDLSLEGYDFIYIGTGTEDNLMEANRRLAPFQDAILASAKGDTLWLATGNAMTLFGRSICRYNNTVSAIGCFDYATTIEDDKRYLGDVLTKEAFGGALVGFVNTSSVYDGVTAPLLNLRLGEKLGNDKRTAADGMIAGNFYGTQLIGPVLVKNPHFLAHICQKLTGEACGIDQESNIQKAYQVALRELSARI